MTQTIRIAMWSGPRNLSTATMRSFGARSDTSCIDEPYYAAYLERTGLNHPMRTETLTAHPTNLNAIAYDLSLKEKPTAIYYQKHMTHHMIDDIPRDWMKHVRNAFLIRHPARVLASYAKKAEAVSLRDIGFLQQADIFDAVQEMTGETPIVVDSDDILRDPAGTLARLCSALDIPYTDEMLSWSKGPKPEDGAWAPHWYDSVNASTGFGAAPGPVPDISPGHAGIFQAALPIYERLAKLKI